MLTLIAATLLSGEGIDSSFNGLWVGSGGEVFTIYEGGFRTRVGDFLYKSDASSSDPNKEPDYIYSSSTSQGSYLNSVESGGYFGGWKCTKAIGWNTRFGQYMMPNPNASSEFGTSRITYGPLNSANQVDSLVFDVKDSHGLTKFSGPTWFAGKSSKMNVGGIYESSGVKISLSETGERSIRTESGTVTAFGKTYSLSGHRKWEFGQFELTNRETGAKAGYGWFVWSPTKSFTESLRGENPGNVDRIRAWVYLTNGEFPNGKLGDFMRGDQ